MYTYSRLPAILPLGKYMQLSITLGDVWAILPLVANNISCLQCQMTRWWAWTFLSLFKHCFLMAIIRPAICLASAWIDVPINSFLLLKRRYQVLIIMVVADECDITINWYSGQTIVNSGLQYLCAPYTRCFQIGLEFLSNWHSISHNSFLWMETDK